MDVEETVNLTNQIEDADPNFTNIEDGVVYEHDGSFYLHLFLELFTVVALISIIAVFILCFVIIKYKRLRSATTNMILLHLNIVQAVYLFCTPLTLRAVSAIDYRSTVHVTVFCILNEAESVLLVALFFFMVLLVVDWYIKTYNENRYAKFSKIYKFFVIMIYVLIGSMAAATTRFCVTSYFFFHFTLLFVFLLYILMIVFMIIMNIVHQVKVRKLTTKPKNNLGLGLSNIFVILWSFPLFFAILAFVGISLPVALIIMTTVGFSSPIFNLVYLYSCDINYNVFLKTVMRCECNAYQNEPLEDTSVVYSDANGVHISNHTHI